MKSISVSTKSIILSIAIISLIGCTSRPTVLGQTESKLKTDSKRSSLLFHSSLYYPNEIALNTEGFIVGVEKSPVKIIVSDESKLKIDEVNFKNSSISEKTAREEIVDHKILFVSHIMENFGKPYSQSNCALYDAYRNLNNTTDKIITKKCNLYQNGSNQLEQTYVKSWDALDILSTALKQKISTNNYSHIVVITMGWNTTQEEAMRNFNSILYNITKASGTTNADGTVINPSFKPLVIGVTWPSQLESTFLNATVGKATSFVTKRGDADELGLTWLGVLLNKTIPESNTQKIPVVAIGHSFGARATTTAACFGPAIYQDSPYEFSSSKAFRQGRAGSELRRPVQYLIALQGAFSEKRILNKKGDAKGVTFNGCQGAEKILLTASKHDTAVSSVIWGSYAGAKYKSPITRSARGILKYCDANNIKTITNPDLQCAKAMSTGSLTTKLNDKVQISYVDADDLIEKNAYLSGGSAHSDIYRYEHGKLMWDFINQSNSTK